MSHCYAFVGLTPSERSLLDSLFAQEGGQLVRVRKTQDAHLLLVNGDDRSAIRRVREENPSALLVLVGKPPTAVRQSLAELPVIPRPLSLGGVVSVLSTLDWPDGKSSEPTEFSHTFFGISTQSPESAPPSSVPTPADVSADASVAVSAQAPKNNLCAFAPTTAAAPLCTPPRAPVSARHTWVVSEPMTVVSAPAVLAMTRRTMPEPPPSVRADMPDKPHASVLVVSLRPRPEASTLPRGLRRMGYRVHVIDCVRDALAEIERGTASFVFLDQASLGDQLLPLARSVNAHRAVPGQAPYLVVVARGGSAFDRLRARMNSCTWMTVPLDRKRLTSFFAKRGLPRSVAG